MVDVYVSGASINIGRQGENEARDVYFNLTSLIETYGDGTATLVHMRPSDQVPYVCDTTVVNNYLVWRVVNTDTAYAGSGKCELRWVVGDTLAKSSIYSTAIAPSLTGAAEVPDKYQSWYDAIIEYIKANYAANGAPKEVREAIYTLLSKAAYTETGLTDELEVVREWTAEYLTITNNLTHVTNSNAATMVAFGSSYTATLTAQSGYTLNSVTVTMGGEDVTSTVYSSGTITIPSVTGDIVITASAVAAVASLSAVYTQTGTVYDTDALDTLKADLVVTATYGDSSTQVVSDYTLSGTLTAGASTITASYGGKTATFTVTVTQSRESIFGTFVNGHGVSKSTGGAVPSGGIYISSTSARAAFSTPIANNGYTLTVTDSSKYNIAVYDVQDNTPISTTHSQAIEHVYYTGGSKTISWESSDSATTPYILVALKKMDNTAFTDEELANAAEAVFTYTSN